MPLSKAELVQATAAAARFTQKQTLCVIEDFLTTIKEILIHGDSAELRGFGTFYTKTRKPRPARDIRKGKVVPLYERIAPLFTFAPEIKNHIRVPA